MGSHSCTHGCLGGGEMFFWARVPVGNKCFQDLTLGLQVVVSNEQDEQDEGQSFKA